MRRTYISPEFNYSRAYGTFNMLESSSFLGSKMLEIDDNITIASNTIVWYETPNGEQLNLNNELNFPQKSWSSDVDKDNNHELKLDIAQSSFSLDTNTKWILNIKLKEILRNWLFATLKSYRTFEGVKNNMTIDNNVNASILNYIDNNVINRYKFTKLEFYVKSINLLEQGALKFVNNWDSSIIDSNNLLNKYELSIDLNNNATILFSQPQVSTEWCFNYYFNIIFDKL